MPSLVRTAGAILMLAAVSAIPLRVSARDYKVLHYFKGGEDGKWPQSNLLSDDAGNLYGVTPQGGLKIAHGGYGVVFKLAADGTYSLLHVFQGGADGAYPEGDLIKDQAGNLYGTTNAGGAFNKGTVFRLGPDGTNTILYSFGAHSGDAINPQTGLVADASGNLCGTTTDGGASNQGAIYKIATDDSETVLYSFCAKTNCADGSQPDGGLLLGTDGNLYGNTTEGGGSNSGTVFRLSLQGNITTLYSFAGGTTDGAYPVARLTEDSNENLYGITNQGGANTYGTVFMLASTGTETVLHSFCVPHSCGDGAYPNGSLLLDAKGNLVGTTYQYGANASSGGVVFKLKSHGTLTILHQFEGLEKGGGFPEAGVINVNGLLYGTAHAGGKGCPVDNQGCGVIFQIKR